jgi:hypothetical protein
VTMSREFGHPLRQDFGHPPRPEFQHPSQSQFQHPFRPQFQHPPQPQLQLPGRSDVVACVTPTGRASPGSLIMPPPNGYPDVRRHVGNQPPIMPRCTICDCPRSLGCLCTCCPKGLLPRARLECQQLAVQAGHKQPDANQVLSDETKSAITRSHRPPYRPSALAPSLKFDPVDDKVLSKLDFRVYRAAVAAEVTELRRLAFKCVLTDAWAVGKPSRLCQAVADKHVQAFFDNAEDHLRGGNPKFNLEPDNCGKEIYEKNGDKHRPSSPNFRSEHVARLLEDSTVRQYVYLADKLIYQMMPASEELGQIRQDEQLANVNQIGMRKHLAMLKQWNAEWRRQADDRVERGNRSWHAGPVGIDVRTTEVVYFPGLETRNQIQT